MGHEMVTTKDAPGAIGPYSQAVKSGGWVFVSGQIGLDPKTGELVAEEFAGQAEQCLENMRHILAAAGLELEDVVAVDVFLTDMQKFTSFNAIYENFFGRHRPARAVVEVKGLPRGALVEIKCVAYRD